jgi:hypothetical protein
VVADATALKKIPIKRLGVNYGHSSTLNDENAKNKLAPTAVRDKCQIPECYRINGVLTEVRRLDNSYDTSIDLTVSGIYVYLHTRNI